MCNFCIYFKKTTDANILYNINKYGTSISFSIKNDSDDNPLLKKIETQHITSFIEKAEELNLIMHCSLTYEEIISDIPLSPFIGGYDKIAVVKGNNFSLQDRQKNHIWLSEEYSASEGINVGDIVTINIKRATQEFIVKGITNSSDAYIDYSYFDITKVVVTNDQTQYNNYSIILDILALQKTAPKNTIISEGSMFYSAFYFVLGVSIFLTIFCILFSLGSVLNTLKINIEDNDYSIGIMKSLGIKKGALLLYISTQIFIIIVISTVIATIFSWILTTSTLDMQLSAIGKIFAYEVSVIRSGFSFLLPLLNLFILFIVLLLGSLKMLKKYITKNVIEIVQEAE